MISPMFEVYHGQWGMHLFKCISLNASLKVADKVPLYKTDIFSDLNIVYIMLLTVASYFLF